MVSGLKLVKGDVPNDKQIHHMRDGAVVLYKRTKSGVWQVRFKLWDRQWHRFTTKYKELEYARRVAGDLYDRARFKEEMGLPLRTKRFAAVAQLCSQQLEQEVQQGLRPMTNKDYQRVIRKYLVPFFGKYNLTSLDSKLVREFEIWRNQQIGHMPVASTLMTHSAAFNRVIATAVEQGWLNKNHNLPILSRRGPKSTARPGFTGEEVKRLLAFLPEWAEGGHRHTGRQIKLLLRDYVEVLLTTGMRCGKESLNMLWQHIEWHVVGEQRYLRIWVSGKTGGNQVFNGLAWLNVLASCSSAVAAYGLLILIIRRPVALNQLKELLLLAGVYTLINPSLHFIFWHVVQAYTEASMQDFVAMAVGDLAGAVLGSMFFVWVVRHTGVAQWVAGRVHAKIDR